MPISSDDPRALSDLNLAEAARQMVRWNREHRIEEHDGLLLVAGADPFPIGYGNCAMALGRDSSPDPERIPGPGTIVVLQASVQGEPIYQRMGYREITRYRWCAKGPSPHGA